MPLQSLPLCQTRVPGLELQDEVRDFCKAKDLEMVNPADLIVDAIKKLENINNYIQSLQQSIASDVADCRRSTPTQDRTMSHCDRLLAITTHWITALHYYQ